MIAITQIILSVHHGSCRPLTYLRQPCATCAMRAGATGGANGHGYHGMKYRTQAINRLTPTNCRKVFVPYHSFSLGVPFEIAPKTMEINAPKPTR